MNMMNSNRLRSIVWCFFTGTIVLSACSKSSSDDPASPPANNTSCTGTPGPLFLAVKDVLAANCVSCHTTNGQASFANFNNNCTIVSQASNIRTRAVVQGNMPPSGAISQADKDKINAWVAAGGRLTD
jgi:uncharacterized membrane protein